MKKHNISISKFPNIPLIDDDDKKLNIQRQIKLMKTCFENLQNVLKK